MYGLPGFIALKINILNRKLVFDTSLISLHLNISDVTFVEVENGRVDPAKIIEAVLPNTCLVTCIMANNETGVIQVLQ